MRFDTAAEDTTPANSTVVNIDPEISSPWEAKFLRLEIAGKIRAILQTLPKQEQADGSV